MYESLFVTSFVFAFVLFLVFRQGRWLSPSDFFFFAFFIQYGVHAGLSPDFLQLKDYQSSATEFRERYLLGLSIAYLGTVLGFIIGRFRFVRLRVNDVRMEYNQEYSMWLLFASLFLVVFMVYLQGVRLPVTMEYANFVLGRSNYDYTTIRREMFPGHPYVLLSELLRYSVTALAFAGASFLILKAKYASSKSLWIFILSVVFVFAAMQLNKFPFVYFFGLFIVVWLYDRIYRRVLIIDRRVYLFTAFIFVAALALLFVLYTIQYRDQLAAKTLSSEDLMSLVSYRVFFASNDGLRSWFEIFPEIVAYVGINNIGMLRHFGLDYINVTTLIPGIVLGEDVLTSFQTGYIGSAYASFGFLGIGVISLLVGIVVAFSDWFAASRRSHFARVVVSSVLSLNLIALTAREFHTALLSGGVLSVVIVIAIGSLLRSFIKSAIRREGVARWTTD